MPQTELDVQITRPAFMVEREPNADWQVQRSACDKLAPTSDPDEISCVLAYAKSGTAYYTLGDGKRHIVTRGNVLFIREGERYAGVSDAEDPWSFYSCRFGLIARDDASRALLDGLPRIFRCSDSTQMRENFAQLNRIWTAKQPGYLLKCRSLILDILYILLWDEKRRSIHSAHYKVIDDIVEEMRCNYSRSYSLEELSAMAGLSGSYFRMLFKQMTGCTTVQFQNRLKIEKAKDLILSRTCNVTEAARAVGFSDVFYFSRMFKKLTGKNPSEYVE